MFSVGVINLMLKETPLYERVGKRVRCGICERRCLLEPGMKGTCGNRVNVDGKLMFIGYGRLSAVESRPIEIKPYFHYWPGSSALTFSNWGCNLLCPWCQNWHLSFRHPDPDSDSYYPPEEIVELALRMGDEGLCASFNEPTTQFEYLLDVFELGSRKGLYSCIVSNGYMSLRALEMLAESGMTGFKADIKGCPDSYRRFLGADVEVVYRNARRALDLGLHVEMVFLLIPGVNSGKECIEWVIKRHLDLLGPDVPLHINRYYPAFKFSEPPTPLPLLEWAWKRAREEGINYVYIGNVPGHPAEHTYCPKCGKAVIVRSGYEVLEYLLDRDGRCPRCNTAIPITGSYVRKRIRWRHIF